MARMAQGEGVKIFADIRKLFGEMADQIDALVVSDYDHFHGVACGAALRAGKPVCSERPLGLTISDARACGRWRPRQSCPPPTAVPAPAPGSSAAPSSWCRTESSARSRKPTSGSGAADPIATRCRKASSRSPRDSTGTSGWGRWPGASTTRIG